MDDDDDNNNKHRDDELLSPPPPLFPLTFSPFLRLASLPSDVGDQERVGHASYESDAGCGFHHLSVSRSRGPKATLSGVVDGSVWTAE